MLSTNNKIINLSNNVLLMLLRRNMINMDTYNNNILLFNSTVNNNYLFKINGLNNNTISIIIEKYKKKNDRNIKKDEFKNLDIFTLDDHKNSDYKIIIANIGTKIDLDKIYQDQKIKGIIEIIPKSILSTDIINHVFSPIYEPLSQIEKNNLMAQKNILDQDLPKLKWDDPIRIYFNLNVGDVIKIIRKSFDGSTDISYRIVINDL